MVKIRMCVCCKKRLPQDSMLRLQVKESALSLWTRFGRSFYVCSNCIEQPKTTNTICKIFKIDDNECVVNFFKEIAWQNNQNQ